MQHRRQARYCFYPRERFYLGTGKQYSVVQSARTRVPPTERPVNQMEATIYDAECQEMSIVHDERFLHPISRELDAQPAGERRKA
jgi:hypothetical protein